VAGFAGTNPQWRADGKRAVLGWSRLHPDAAAVELQAAAVRPGRADALFKLSLVGSTSLRATGSGFGVRTRSARTDGHAVFRIGQRGWGIRREESSHFRPCVEIPFYLFGLPL